MLMLNKENVKIILPTPEFSSQIMLGDHMLISLYSTIPSLTGLLQEYIIAKCHIMIKMDNEIEQTPRKFLSMLEIFQ